MNNKKQRDKKRSAKWNAMKTVGRKDRRNKEHRTDNTRPFREDYENRDFN